jgi:hypothetical protein
MSDLEIRAALLLAATVSMFALAVRIGILIGRRLDGALEHGPHPADLSGEGATVQADPGRDLSSGQPQPSSPDAARSARPARRTRGV